MTSGQGRGQALSRPRLVAAAVRLTRAMAELANAREAYYTTSVRDRAERDATVQRWTAASVAVGAACWELASELFPDRWTDADAACRALVKAGAIPRPRTAAESRRPVAAA